MHSNRTLEKTTPIQSKTTHAVVPSDTETIPKPSEVTQQIRHLRYGSSGPRTIRPRQSGQIQAHAQTMWELTGSKRCRRGRSRTWGALTTDPRFPLHSMSYVLTCSSRTPMPIALKLLLTIRIPRSCICFILVCSSPHPERVHHLNLDERGTNDRQREHLTGAKALVGHMQLTSLLLAGERAMASMYAFLPVVPPATPM